MNSIGYQFVRFFYSDTLFEQEINMRNLILISVVILMSGCVTTLYDEFNPSPQRVRSIAVSSSDYNLCHKSFDNVFGSARSKEIRYRFRKQIVLEIKKRNLNCKTFREFSKKENWMEDWVNEYELFLTQRDIR